MIFGRKMAKIVRCTHFPPHLICVTTLPCETQMFQIVKKCCKNPENSKQQRILTHSIQDNENWIFLGLDF